MNEDNSAFDYLLRHLDEQRERATGSIVSGRATPDEYHRLCGVIQGLNYAKDLIKDLAKRRENDDE